MAKKETASPFAIDEMALNKEWLGQADLYYSYASQLAEARLALDEAKREADVIEADLSLQIREDPEQFDCPKVTESAIKEVVKLQEEFQDSRVSVNDAQHKVNLLQAAVTALDHRKRALEKLVDLHGTNYFSEPHARSDGGKEFIEQQKKKAARRRSVNK
jgi:hypothetical protein